LGNVFDHGRPDQLDETPDLPSPVSATALTCCEADARHAARIRRWRVGPSDASFMTLRFGRAPGVWLSLMLIAPWSAATPVGLRFDDEFSSLSLHRTWRPGDHWQLIAPDSTDGRGGPAWNEAGSQWWVNPCNPYTPISGVYSLVDGKLKLSILPTPSAYQAYIDRGSGKHLPYVGALLNTSKTDYQKFGYYEVSASVDRVPGFSFQADTENVQVSGHWPPEIDLNIYTDASNVQFVTFEVKVSKSANLSYTLSSSDGFDASVTHTYAWDWQSDYISLYIDGAQVWRTANPGGVYKTDKQFLYLVTYANHLGRVDPNSASLPAYAHLDYVRIYQNKPAASGSHHDAAVINRPRRNFVHTNPAQSGVSSLPGAMCQFS
jgi:beta-glucanase (GH16 family)